jgi:hypothetical protein
VTLGVEAVDGVPACPGCVLVVGPVDGPVHPYIGASPGCWAAFNDLMISDLGGEASGQVVGDTYAVQHPGVPQRRAIQSVCVHLITLCATLERGWPSERAVHLRRAALARPPAQWRWLDLALPLGRVTVADVLAAPTPEDRGRLVRHWADDVWLAYSPVQGEVRAWEDALLR